MYILYNKANSAEVHNVLNFKEDFKNFVFGIWNLEFELQRRFLEFEFVIWNYEYAITILNFEKY